MEQVHRVILNTIFTKDLDNKVFDHKDPWVENLASISWAIIDSYHSAIMYIPGQSVSGREMIFNLASVVD